MYTSRQTGGAGCGGGLQGSLQSQQGDVGPVDVVVVRVKDDLRHARLLAGRDVQVHVTGNDGESFRDVDEAVEPRGVAYCLLQLEG